MLYGSCQVACLLREPPGELLSPTSMDTDILGVPPLPVAPAHVFLGSFPLSLRVNFGVAQESVFTLLLFSICGHSLVTPSRVRM